uniref:Gnk2-homologous domain-containing protein n=1 Tax=Chenopodium quinoa TaxID=63459 RepID=A0A803KUI5_CHEQI
FGRYSLLSDYETNVETAIDELASRASTTYYGKYATGLGEDRVIAVFSCRYDITNEDCQDCVASTANNVSRCFSDVEGLIVYEECTLHYSNRSISGIMEDNPQIISYSTGLDEDFRFNQLLDNTVTDLIKDVTSEFAVSSRYFATTTAEYSSSETIYALAQCNPDISSINCRLCLRTIYDDFMSNYTGTNYGQIFTRSCRLSYILSSEELSEPWMFAQTFDERNRYRTPRYSPRYFASSGMISCS